MYFFYSFGKYILYILMLSFFTGITAHEVASMIEGDTGKKMVIFKYVSF